MFQDEGDAVAHVVVAALVGGLGHQAGHPLFGHLCGEDAHRTSQSVRNKN